jgi:DNA-binding response OmpR family regulator
MRDLSILICDDEAELVEELAEFLAASGWRTHGCLAGANAERLLRDGLAPSCLMTDLRLGEFDGEALIRAVRRLPAALRPRVIAVMTGHVADQLRAADLGADLLYVKPIDPFAIAGDLHRLLGSAAEPAVSERRHD